MNTGAIIAAAGRSRRMGHPKALLRMPDGRSFVRHLVDTFGAAGLTPVVVVLGAQAERVLADDPVVRGAAVVAVNRDPRTEMIDSLRLGERYLPESVGAVAITPVDAPFVDLALMQALLAAWQPQRLVVPVAAGRPGHPVLVPRQALHHPAASRDGIRGLMASGALQVVEVPWKEERITAQLNTPGDLERHLPDALPDDADPGPGSA